MVKIPEEVKVAIEKTSPICVATANGEAVPNIIYVKFLKYLDETTVVLADNKLAKTKNNILTNANLAFVVLDPDTKTAYQLKGKTEYIEDGEEFESVRHWVMGERPDLNTKGAVYIKITEIYSGEKKLA